MSLKTTSISIAIPVLNGANFLAEALASITSQDDSDFDVVVSDNCSDDATPDILRECAARDRRIRVIPTETRLGQQDNVNRAVDLCRGDWIKVLCHDDLLERRCISSLRDVLAVVPDSCGLVGHGESWLFANGHLHRGAGGATLRQYAGHEYLQRYLSGRALAPLPALTNSLVRREAWERSQRFDRRYYHFDVYLWSQMLRVWDYAYLSTTLTINRIHGRQVAVEARQSLRSAIENDEFWRAFTAETARELGLGARAQVRALLRGPNTAGSAIAVELMKRDAARVLRLVRRTPRAWWCIMPLAVGRAFRHERRRTRELRQHVPVELIYP